MRFKAAIRISGTTLAAQRDGSVLPRACSELWGARAKEASRGVRMECPFRARGYLECKPGATLVPRFAPGYDGFGPLARGSRECVDGCRRRSGSSARRSVDQLKFRIRSKGETAYIWRRNCLGPRGIKVNQGRSRLNNDRAVGGGNRRSVYRDNLSQSK